MKPGCFDILIVLIDIFVTNVYQVFLSSRGCTLLDIMCFSCLKMLEGTVNRMGAGEGEVRYFSEFSKFFLF